MMVGANRSLKQKNQPLLKLKAMKKIVFALGFLMVTSICVGGHNYFNYNVPISVQTFYDELAPYGEWIYHPQYGYTWSPYLPYYEDFKPYVTRGHWVFTDLGWTWVSDYPWGWATFHYGRWFFDDYFGWMWIPGYEWAPAWVTWGYYDGYWAWAPMGPNMYVMNNYSWRAPAFWWTFVPFRYFCSTNWYSYIYNRPVQINNITYITYIYNGNNPNSNQGNWYYGPRVKEVEKYSTVPVQKRTFEDASKPDKTTIRDNKLVVYRPEIDQKQDNQKPVKFRTVEEGKANPKAGGPADQRTGGEMNKQTTPPAGQRTGGEMNKTVPNKTEPTKKTTTTAPTDKQTTPSSTKSSKNKSTAPSKTNTKSSTHESSSSKTTSTKPGSK